eukprot:7304303-Alexandrium_andersonii.AAC.1
MYDNGANKFPRLMGKGSEMRHFLQPLLAVWTAHMQQDDLVHKQIKMALSALVELEDLMDRHAATVVWPRADSQRFLRQVQVFLALQTAVARHYHRQA